jgi:TatA/E family protein of Tat protein translocase
MEIIIVLALALLIFGPKRLPEMGRTLGRAAREFRKATDEVKGVFDIGLNDDEDAKAAGAAVVTTPAPLHTPGHEPWWEETLAAAGSPAPATDERVTEAVPGLAGFLGVAQAAPEADASAAGDDGSAAPAFAGFLGASARAVAGDPPVQEAAPEQSATPDDAQGTTPGGSLSAQPEAAPGAPVADAPVAPEAPEAPAAAEAG